MTQVSGLGSMTLHRNDLLWSSARLIVAACFHLFLWSIAWAAPDPAVSSRHSGPEGLTVNLLQPEIDDWENLRVLRGRIPFELRAGDGEAKQSGSARFEAGTVVHFEDRTVSLTNPLMHEVRFAGAARDASAEQLLRRHWSEHPPVISLDVLLRALPADFELPRDATPPAQLNFNPPRIVVANQPTQLVLIDGPPATVPVAGTDIEFVVNTDWSIFHHPSSESWFILNQGHWTTNRFLASGRWRNTDELPSGFLTLQVSSDWPEVGAAMPPDRSEQEPLPLLISYEPTVLVQVDGAMEFEPAGSAGLEYVRNTRSDLFRWNGRYYLLASGRWFQTKDVKRKWYAVKQLPETFAGIPSEHPRSHVLAAVPGTEAARLAGIEAAIPRMAVVRPGAASELEIPYAGEPSFVEVQGTQLRRAENTPYQVLMHNNFYYLCHEGAWYASSRPQGPWRPAREIPAAIYTIPPTDPAFNVTFVRLAAFDDSSGEAAYQSTSGYYSRYWTGNSVVYGTGWYYPGYYNRSVYWRYPYTYGYGWWGPYGYPYPTYRSETFEVSRPEKDWQWDLNGNKRAVYDYGPGNYVGGRYQMPDSDNFKAGGEQ